MNNEQTATQDFQLQLLCELHEGLERQGPGSPEMTIRALSFLDNRNETLRVADLGCGTGGQTRVLAQHIKGSVVGVDLFPAFINVFNEQAKNHHLQERVTGVVGSMDQLSFPKEEFDLIWSEGAIANIGFEKGLNHWWDFLKKGGYVAVTYESWFTEERPAEIEKWWVDAVPEINTIGHNISVMQKAGYVPVAAFTLPEQCWTDAYFIPREAAGKALLEKYPGNKTAVDFIATMTYEAELYEKYRRYYGYAFYIGKKM